jgi:protein ImuB
MKRVASLYLPDWSIDLVRRAERPAASPPPERRALDLLPLKQAGDAEQGGKACDAPKNTGWRPGARWARTDDAALARPLPGVDEATGGAGACWAGETRADVARRVARLPAHQQPPMREMGRRSEAADHPYKRLPGDEGGVVAPMPTASISAVRRHGGRDPLPSVRTGGEGVRPSLKIAVKAWNTMPSVAYPGDGPHPDKLAAKERRPGSNDAGATVKEVAAFFDTGRSTAGAVARVCAPESAFAPPAGPADDMPLVTVHKVGSRIEVAAASPAARALGAEPGMALTQVRAAVPDIAVRDADPDGDAAALRRLAVALARRWTPVVAVSDSDGLVLDLTGVAHLHGGEGRMARRLVRGLARLGIAARVGIADTAGAAWALARYAGERVAILPPGDPLPALAPFPVAALRIEDHALDLLRRLGIDTVGALAAMPRGPLARRFGRIVPLRLDQASGRAPEPLDPVTPPEPIAVEQRFAEPLLTAEPIAYWLGQLVLRLSVALAKAGQGARAIALAATRVDAAVQVVRIGLARPTRAPDHLLRLLARRIEALDPGFGIETLALHVVRADPLGPEALAGDLAEGTTPDLAPLVDALVNRIGPRRLWRTSAVESDVPERAVARAAPLDPPAAAAARLKRDDVRRLDTRAATDPWHPRWPRPVRLLRRPEPVDHVMAQLPDSPPARFTWRGVTHRIVRGDGPERITGEWWRRTQEAHAVRDYFAVEDDTGERFWLFRRGDGMRPETGDLTWYVHGTFA